MNYFIVLALLYIIVRTIFQGYLKSNKTDRYSVSLISSGLTFSFFLGYYFIRNNYSFNFERLKEIIFNKYALIEGVSSQGYFFALISALPLLPFSLSTPLTSIWLFFALFLEPFILDDYSMNLSIIGIFILFVLGLLTINYHHISKGFNLKKYPQFKLGIILLIISSLSRAIQVTYTKKIGHMYETDELILMSFALTFLIAITMFLYKYLFTDYKPYLDKVFYLILICFFVNNLSVFLRFYSIQNISEDLFILITQTAIILSIFIGYYFFKEKIMLNQLIGFLIIVTSIYLMIKNENSDIKIHK
jgi:drug/metabolite transporter (DMT)-like permease